MITCRFVVAPTLIGCGIPYFVDAGEGRADDAAPVGTDVLTAADFVQAALEAESTGNGADRSQFLKEALLQDPDYVPARWQSGFLQSHDKWLTIAEVEAQYRADTRLADYQQFRASLPESPQRDLLLGRWCQAQSLTDQAAFHCGKVLEADPYHGEALQALGVRWYNGELIPADEITKRKKSDFQAVRTASARIQRMNDVLERWENVAANNPTNLQAQMATDLAAEKSRRAIPTFNYLLCERCSNPKPPAACEIVNRDWVHLLAQDRSNTKYVVMHAIGHPLESVRMAAADELQKMAPKDCVPLLLACARFPAEFAWSLMVTGGIVRAEYTVDVQGLEADAEFEHVGSYELVDDLIPWVVLSQQSKLNPLLDSDTILAKRRYPMRRLYPKLFTADATNRAQGIRNWVDEYNASATEINRRVTLALERATGEDLDSNPRSWQTWWSEYVSDVYEVETVQAGGGRNDNNQGRGPGNQGRGQQNAGGQQPGPVYQFILINGRLEDDVQILLLRLHPRLDQHRSAPDRRGSPRRSSAGAECHDWGTGLQDRGTRDQATTVSVDSDLGGWRRDPRHAWASVLGCRQALDNGQTYSAGRSAPHSVWLASGREGRGTAGSGGLVRIRIQPASRRLPHLLRG